MNLRRRLLLKTLATFTAAATFAARAVELKIGQAAPAATLVTLDGQRISTAALRGQTIILVFWATWCDPCREELPLLSSYTREHAAQRLQVLGFSLDDPDSTAKVRAVADTLAFPVGLLSDSDASGYGRIWRIPVSFVIDSNGRLQYNGWQAKDPALTKASLDRIVGPLLNK